MTSKVVCFNSWGLSDYPRCEIKQDNSNLCEFCIYRLFLKLDSYEPDASGESGESGDFIESVFFWW